MTDPNEVRYIIVRPGKTKQQSFLRLAPYGGFDGLRRCRKKWDKLNGVLGYTVIIATITREEADNYLLQHFS